MTYVCVLSMSFRALSIFVFDSVKNKKGWHKWKTLGLHRAKSRNRNAHSKRGQEFQLIFGWSKSLVHSVKMSKNNSSCRTAFELGYLCFKWKWVEGDKRKFIPIHSLFFSMQRPPTLYRPDTPNVQGGAPEMFLIDWEVLYAFTISFCKYQSQPLEEALSLLSVPGGLVARIR